MKTINQFLKFTGALFWATGLLLSLFFLFLQFTSGWKGLLP